MSDEQVGEAMRTFIGSKFVNAKPMTRGEYKAFRGWTVPADEDPSDDGYLVEYLDGGKANTPHCAGYVSWSPKPQFDAAYRETSGLSFGLAIEALKKGSHVARAGWNGKGMWLALVGEGHYDVGSRTVGEAERLLPWIGMKTADNGFVPWLASQTDMLADDWLIVE